MINNSNSNNSNNSNSAYDATTKFNVVGDHPITIIKKDSNFHLSFLPSSKSQLSSIINIPIWQDQRLEHLDIPRNLIELLQINGFTIERILEYGPSQIAKILRIDDYVAEIIFSETTEVINNYS